MHSIEESFEVKTLLKKWANLKGSCFFSVANECVCLPLLAQFS